MLKISDLSNSKILVLGDVMLDRYLFGSTERVSPEAPVPVVCVSDIDERPGGAANVAMNLSKIGVKTTIFGLVGDDLEGASLEQILVTEKIKCNLRKIKDLSTTTKTRIQSRGQQLIRYDRDAITQTHYSFFDALKKDLSSIDAVIISDYAKGVVTDISEIIDLCKSHKVPILVDPKGTDFRKYEGADILTPNQGEFEAIVGPCGSDKLLVEKAREMIKGFNLKALLITRSDKGMLLVERNGEATFLDTRAVDVFDVTGAGDTVISIFAASLSAGYSFIEAAKFANYAAGVVVGKIGTAYITQAELQDYNPFSTVNNDTQKTLSQLDNLVNLCRRDSKKVVMTNGCFDILHAGHIAYLEQARSLGDKLIVAVNSDDSVKRLKGQARPINSLNDRVKVLRGLSAVDWIITFDEDTPLKLITALKPNVLVKGGDYEIGEVIGGKEVIESGGEVQILCYEEGFSTSAIIEKLQT
jgi:D-beta-D-heptose 7-phosphate kinase / D-beta-D-heptose 1-phosphate adenosyltransferase